MKEIWKPIEKYHNHLVSNFGRIKNRITGRILKLRSDKNGYLRLNFKYNSKHTTEKVHRLVAKAFISNPMLKRDMLVLFKRKRNGKLK